MTTAPITPADDRLLRVREAAAVLGVSERHVRRLAELGVLSRVRIGRLWRVRASEVQRLIDDSTDTPTQSVEPREAERAGREGAT